MLAQGLLFCYAADKATVMNRIEPLIHYRKGGNIMRRNKLAPWNWFNREHEESSVPVRRRDSAGHPGHPVERIHDQIDRMFDDFFRGYGFPNREFGETWDEMTRSGLFKPNLDISESDREYSVAVELPGVEQKNVELELVDDVLKIKGEKKQESEKKDKNYHCIERSYGTFQRVLNLPDDADRDGIQAEYKNGIMTITIPRQPGKKPGSKRIDIKSA
jgi:HSP20 family protein